MIFQHTHELVMAGKKSQTRRLVMSGDEYRGDYVYYIDDGWCGHEGPYPAYPGRVKWAVGKDYAVQPGRGKKAVGRIRLTGIRQEHVQDITEADANAEGCVACMKYGLYMDAIDVYSDLWDTIHTKPGTRWADSPLVWVLEFKLAKEA